MKQNSPKTEWLPQQKVLIGGLLICEQWVKLLFLYLWLHQILVFRNSCTLMDEEGEKAHTFYVSATSLLYIFHWQELVIWLHLDAKMG